MAGEPRPVLQFLLHLIRSEVSFAVSRFYSFRISVRPREYVVCVIARELIVRLMRASIQLSELSGRWLY